MFSAVFKFNKNHDAKGRFASASGFAAEEGPAAKFSKELNKPKYTPEEMVSKAFNGNKDLIAEFNATNERVRKAVEAGGETYRHHVTNLEDLDSGKAKRPRYSEDRLKEHRRTIDEVLAEAHKHQAKEGEAPEVIFVGGRGGSGLRVQLPALPCTRLRSCRPLPSVATRILWVVLLVVWLLPLVASFPRIGRLGSMLVPPSNTSCR